MAENTHHGADHAPAAGPAAGGVPHGHRHGGCRPVGWQAHCHVQRRRVPAYLEHSPEPLRRSANLLLSTDVGTLLSRTQAVSLLFVFISTVLCPIWWAAPLTSLKLGYRWRVLPEAVPGCRGMAGSLRTRLLALGSEMGVLRLMDATSDGLPVVARIRLHSSSLQLMCFSPDGRWLATWAADRRCDLSQ